MEYDFSDQAKEFLESQAAKRPGRKSGAQTPAKPSERKKGSKKNPKGSAGGGKKAPAITFSEKVITALKNKVKEHNAKYSKKVTLGQLKKVYRRGAGAFSSSHRPGKSRGQWSMARVNTFLKMVRGGKVKESYRAADGDIARGSEEYYNEPNGEVYIDYNEVEFGLAKIDLLKAGVDEIEMDQDIEDIDYSEAEKKTLNKPFRLPSGSKKKFGVYVKNPKGNIVMVKFGDPNMEIKRDDPARRRNFRARHQCDTNPGPKHKARYWSCRFWSKKPVNKMTSSEALAWDDEEVLSEWGWDDANFAEQQDLLNSLPFLSEVKEVVEEEGL
tara:strand:- start:178 stop:1158 length:981 start_codon:yes stop_codon:yes gene_type:complete